MWSEAIGGRQPGGAPRVAEVLLPRLRRQGGGGSPRNGVVAELGVERVVPAPAAIPRVFLCHASPDKAAVRTLARRLETLGYDTWLDEEGIRPGAGFRERIEQELARATHLVAWVTEAWAASTWPGLELDLFRERQPDGVVAVLPTLADAAFLPAALRERNAITLERYSSEQADWLLHCAIEGREVGPQRRWEARAAQVRDEVGRIPDFSRDELLDAARRILSGEADRAPLARNAALRCLVLGIDPAWVEEALPLDRAVELYTRALAAEVLPAPKLWPRLARLVDAGATLPAHIDQQVLVRTVTTAPEVPVVVAALRILRRVGADDAALRALRQWIDPDQAPSARDPAPAAMVRGDTTVLDATLDLLFDSPSVDPTVFFRGYAAELIGAAEWWAVYFRHLARLATCERLPVARLAARLREAVSAGEEDPEQLMALCEVVGDLRGLVIPLEVPLQELLHALRHRVREPWLAARGRVASVLLERHPRVVFIRLWPILPHFTARQDALPAARMTGLAAQEPGDVEVLLTRLARTSDPEERVLLFEAAVGSPADVPDATAVVERVTAATGRDDPLVHAAATLLGGESLRAFQASLAYPRQATRFLDRQPPLARVLWPWMLGREFTAPDAGPGAWAGLSDCARVAMDQLARDALNKRPAPELETLRDVAHDAEPADLVVAWDQAVGVLSGLGRDLLDAAEKAQAQLRWLHSGLERLPPDVRGGLEQLEAALRGWLAAVPDVALALSAQPAPTLRHELTSSPEWLALVAVLASAPVAQRLDQHIYPRMSGSPSTRSTLVEAMQRMEEADALRSLAHRICIVDELLGWLASKPGLPGRDGLLWALMLRTHGHRCPGLPEHQRHDQLVAALVDEYRDAPGALIESTRSLRLDADSHLDIIYAHARAQPDASEAWLLETLTWAAAEPHLEKRVVEGLGLLATGPPSAAALPLLRDLVVNGNPRVAGAAASALRAGSRDPEDTLRLLDLALRTPTAVREVKTGRSLERSQLPG